MNYVEQRSRLIRQGYTVVKNCLPDSLLEKLRQQRDEVLSQLPACHRENYKSQGSLVNLGDHPEFSHLIALSDFQSLMKALGFADESLGIC